MNRLPFRHIVQKLLWKRVFRRLHFFSYGISSEILFSILKLTSKFTSSDSAKPLSVLPSPDLVETIGNPAELSSEIAANGFVYVGNILPSYVKLITEEVTRLRRTQMNEPRHQFANESDAKLYLSVNSLDVARLEYSQEDMFNSECISYFFNSYNLISIARAYFGCEPLLDLICGWDSVSTNSTGKDSRDLAAQYPHVDFKHFKFLKFFLFLDPVTDADGPFELWCKSKSIVNRFAYYKDKRQSRSLLNEIYGDSVKLNTSQCCEIFAVDTSIFHCDSPPTAAGWRRCLQLEFTNSMIGGEYNYKKFKLPIEQYSETKYGHLFVENPNQRHAFFV